MPKVPVAYENPRHARYFEEVAKTVQLMGGKTPAEADAIVEQDRQYVESAMRGGIGPAFAAATIFHKHFGQTVVAAERGAGASCPPPQELPAVKGVPVAVAAVVPGASCPPPEEHAPEGEASLEAPCGPFTRMVVDEVKLATCRRAALALGSLSKPENLYALVRPFMERESVEVFVVVGLDVNGVVNCYSEVARGQIDHVAVAPQDILAPVLKSKAFAVAHSHPSGDATPSQDDRTLTARIQKAASLFPGLTFLDHLVVGHGEFYSFTSRRKQRVK